MKHQLLPRYRPCKCAFVLWALLATASCAQTNFSSLAVTGVVAQSLTLNLSDLSQMPRTSVTAREKDGSASVFEGVTLADLIQRAKLKLDKQCCSNAVNAVVIVHAADGYRALFSLPELLPDFTERKILLADRREGKPIPPAQGPLRLIVPDDKAFSRWVRQVNAIEIVIVGVSTKATVR